jgi:hypothetical protein
VLCEVLILLVTFVTNKSLFLREEKPKALAFGFFVLWRVESANFRKRRKTKKHKRPARALVFLHRFPALGSTKLLPFLPTKKPCKGVGFSSQVPRVGINEVTSFYFCGRRDHCKGVGFSSARIP